jgi:hypothetical protein
MKSIVSSKCLHKAIQKAINYDNIKVVVTTEQLELGPVKVKLVSNEYKHRSEFDFDLSIWIKIMVFLRDLPEQPITCEFTSGTIFIYCVKTF